jgi:hypothetical protein
VISESAFGHGEPACGTGAVYSWDMWDFNAKLSMTTITAVITSFIALGAF